MDSSSLKKGCFKKCKAEIRLFAVRDKGIEGTMGAFQNQLIEPVIRSNHGFISDADIGFHHAIRLVVVGRRRTRIDLQNQDVLSILGIWRQNEIWEWNDAFLDQTADLLRVRLRISQADRIPSLSTPKKSVPPIPFAKALTLFSQLFGFFFSRATL